MSSHAGRQDRAQTRLNTALDADMNAQGTVKCSVCRHGDVRGSRQVKYTSKFRDVAPQVVAIVRFEAGTLFLRTKV
jgi:hypothetical protein